MEEISSCYAMRRKALSAIDIYYQTSYLSGTAIEYKNYKEYDYEHIKMDDCQKPQYERRKVPHGGLSYEIRYYRASRNEIQFTTSARNIGNPA